MGTRGMGHRNMRARIKAYRASGRMFGESFSTGRVPPPLPERGTLQWVKTKRFNQWREIHHWFNSRHEGDKSKNRSCLREAIEQYRKWDTQVNEMETQEDTHENTPQHPD